MRKERPGAVVLHRAWRGVNDNLLALVGIVGLHRAPWRGANDKTKKSLMAPPLSSCTAPPGAV